MKKPASLRDYLLDRTPWLKSDPSRLATFVENGQLSAKGSGSLPSSSLCYEQQYRLNLVIIDFSGDPAEIIVPIYEWLSIHQIDLMHNPDWQKNGFSFEAEVINTDLYDLSINLQLTERVIAKVKNKDATITAERYEIEAVDEPQYADLLNAIERGAVERLFSGFNRTNK